MTTLFCVRPATPNIGNAVINRATTQLLYEVFGPDLSVVNVPAIASGGRGGLTAAQVYDMNRFADGVIIGGGNLFENGQLTVDRQALEALQAPVMMIGLSHGRIYDARGRWIERSDSMPSETIRHLVGKAAVTMVRDAASQAILEAVGASPVELGGCPSLFLHPNEPGAADDGRILLSIRHPARMSVPAPLEWRTSDDVRRLIAALRERYGGAVHLVCHDYMDLEFAAGFPDVPSLYFDDVERYIAALRGCRLNVTYRLHAFLPCLSFGVHSMHLSYDERGRAMMQTAGMGDWDIDLMRETDLVGAVLARADDRPSYDAARRASRDMIQAFRATTLAAIRRFAAAVEDRRVLAHPGV